MGLQHGQVVFGLYTRHRGRGLQPVGKGHTDAVRTCHHMHVGEDDARVHNHHTGAHAGFDFAVFCSGFVVLVGFVRLARHAGRPFAWRMFDLAVPHHTHHRRCHLRHGTGGGGGHGFVDECVQHRRVDVFLGQLALCGPLLGPYRHGQQAHHQCGHQPGQMGACDMACQAWLAGGRGGPCQRRGVCRRAARFRRGWLRGRAAGAAVASGSAHPGFSAVGGMRGVPACR